MLEFAGTSSCLALGIYFPFLAIRSSWAEKGWLGGYPICVINPGVLLLQKSIPWKVGLGEDCLCIWCFRGDIFKWDGIVLGNFCRSIQPVIGLESLFVSSFGFFERQIWASKPRPQFDLTGNSSWRPCCDLGDLPLKVLGKCGVQNIIVAIKHNVIASHQERTFAS